MHGGTMQIKLGMPEILILFSLVVYTQSFYFSVASFVLGISGRLIEYLMNYGIEMKKAESVNQNLDELGTAFKDFFSAKED
tara:strand:- start:808 stop:1050 length:243 start_codon:yes stop_codon:yes gene_type:complete